MPSLDHELILLLLRERPEIAVRLLEHGSDLELPAHSAVRIREADFTQIVPTEYRADLVLTLEDEGGPVAAFVIEPQHSRDDDKRFSWPLYTAALHAQVRCPSWLVVFAATERLARWAARPIETFHPGSGFAPLVLAPRDVPRITSVDQAIAMPELAVMSARVYGNDPDGSEVTIATMAAINDLATRDPVRAKLFFDMVWSRLNDAARTNLEAEMEARGYEYQSEFARKYVQQGRDEGRQEGREEGLEEARVALRHACLDLVESRLGEIPSQIENLVAAVTELEELTTLLADIAAAPDAAAILDRLR